MADCQVRCINKVHRESRHEGITHLGNPWSQPNGWRWTREAVIESIESRSNTFFTYEDGRRADILVVNGPNGKYLRTYADGKPTDNLLALPECR